MGNILKFIEEVTEGECFTSFKYSYDGDKVPGIEYETQEETYINLKEYAEEVKDPTPRVFKIAIKTCSKKYLFFITFRLL